MDNIKIPEKYTLRDTTFSTVVKDAVDDRIEIEIGDSKQPDFKPQVKISRWDNEVNFSIRAEEKLGARVETEGEVIKYITPDYEVHQYDKPDAGEDGGFEFEWVLKKKPKSNVLNTTIQSKELDFFYQPELTQEEIDQGAERPENVVGSYAVYHKTKKNNRVGGKSYKTGKAFHIYRPKAIDAEGQETWCDLHIDEGILSVTVPQEFLDTAVYPVVVDPTFGYETNGASLSSVEDRISGTEFSLNESADISSFSVRIRGYSSSALSNLSVYDGTAREGYSVEETGGTLGWKSYSVSNSTTLNSGDYILAAIADSSFNISYDSGGTGKFESITYSYPPPSSSTWTNENRTYSIYATYTAPTNYTLTANRGLFSLTGLNSTLTPSGGSPLIDAVSGTNAGFANQVTPADTDPFNQGEQVCYTVQAADELSAGQTYYWRVRVKDPSGSDTWSDWTTTRSFTTSNAYSITASLGNFTLNGVSSVLNLGRKILSALGTFTLSGVASVLNIGRKMASATGSFVLTGIDVSIITGQSLIASVGNFTLTGVNVVFKNSLTVIANAGSFVLTGFASALKTGLGILAEKGTFALSGINTILRLGVSLTAALGTFTLSGIATGLRKGRILIADAGSFVLSGIASSLNRGIKISAAVGSFTLSGITQILRYGRTMVAALGSFTLTGIAITVGLGVTLVAETGSFILSGISAIVRRLGWFSSSRNTANTFTDSTRNTTNTFTDSTRNTSNTWDNDDRTLL